MSRTISVFFILFLCCTSSFNQLVHANTIDLNNLHKQFDLVMTSIMPNSIMTFHPKFKQVYTVGNSNSVGPSSLDYCCLPPKVSIKSRVFQLAVLHNTSSSTYYSDWVLMNDLENFRARSDVLNTNAGSNTSVYSYRNELDGLTYNYVHMWNQECFCTKTSKADWKKGFCTPPGKLLEESNIAMRIARKYGTERKETNANYSGAYAWTQSVEGLNKEYCWFIGDYVFEVNIYGTVSKTTQFYDMSLNVDEKAFDIPMVCPPPSSCRLV
ncbi:predicted protein [Naegleria gruberi]|uniref:Predicted protein n=1 Tax=Naegleria gruberi TaxID=5762 RepID=D2VXG8_NAEGR|nr:uncharacterized protein NAEGRDRAFT_73742 [Naegleria gruberi]EFC38438.1 predicted protein [Naegleria gruberi]|eukprot:XP_002671182.1 predicted protein [Naegleria gruberi strain NEG-M]